MKKHTNESGNKGKYLKSFKWTPLASILIVVIVLFFLLHFMPHLILSSLGARSKSDFAACTQQLKNIASGLEQQISENGSLKGIRSEDDVCHHILTGYDVPKKCIGQVKARIEEICLKDSFKMKVLDKYRYEIRAKSNTKLQCSICVTESAIRPLRHDPGGECGDFTCIHNND